MDMTDLRTVAALRLSFAYSLHNLYSPIYTTKYCQIYSLHYGQNAILSLPLDRTVSINTGIADCWIIEAIQLRCCIIKARLCITAGNKWREAEKDSHSVDMTISLFKSPSFYLAESDVHPVMFPSKNSCDQPAINFAPSSLDEHESNICSGQSPISNGLLVATSFENWQLSNVAWYFSLSGLDWCSNVLPVLMMRVLVLFLTVKPQCKAWPLTLWQPCSRGLSHWNNKESKIKLRVTFSAGC